MNPIIVCKGVRTGSLLALMDHQPTYREDGRRIRSNYPNYLKVTAEKWIIGPTIRGEGVIQR